ncbi:hypothetical protein LWI28_002568 [Acer negundo]|uniref:Phytocyanin domain-containing protein n=1 Tax=Acer negundo TaxID=4023 RepID=A0AAD5IQ63_ACENE|nr:hypothetical protein LWI28_002568 [Acer negundo]KAK4844544.1 hypothetical protein QYF36_021491 [Acer negundo]
MATILRSPRFLYLWYAFQLLVVLLQTKVLCHQHKVGDLDAWGLPTSADPLVYAKWSKYNTFKIGDSLLFLYPPSQDSVIQVTKQSFESCNSTDPILYMNNGNSLFNITTNGNFYFTSGEAGHCQKKQKLYINVGNVSSADSPFYGPSSAPSYPTVFGSIPQPPSPSSSPSSTSVIIGAVIGSAISAIINGFM